jgi:hypothetical protein
MNRIGLIAFIAASVALWLWLSVPAILGLFGVVSW